MNITNKVYSKIFLVMLALSVFMVGTASAGINITQIIEALDVIWALVENIGDNFGSLITLIMFGVVISLIYIFRDFIMGMFGSILDGMNQKRKK